MPYRAVFLDRDGTINEEVHYLTDASQLALIQGAAEGIQRMKQAGFKVVVITNQAAVARGYMSEQDLDGVHQAMREQLRAADADIDAIYYCPHHPTEGSPPYRRECDCRKPNPGMLAQAAATLEIDLSQSFVVGDKLSDLLAGQRVGCETILVRTGYGEEVAQTLTSRAVQPDHIAANLLEASRWIVDRRRTS